jgi:hypothetical protein
MRGTYTKVEFRCEVETRTKNGEMTGGVQPPDADFRREHDALIVGRRRGARSGGVMFTI